MSTDPDIQVLYDLSDASWQPDNNAVCSLLLLGNHIVKTVFDPAKQRFVSLNDLQLGTEDAEVYASTAKSVSAGETRTPNRRWFVSVFKTLLVPEVLYDEKNSKALLENQHHINPGEIIGSYPVKMIHARMIFAYNGPALTIEKDNKTALVPVDAAWLNSLYICYKAHEVTHFHININHHFISIAVFKDQHLNFYNTFETANAEEVLYFVMFVSEQIGVGPLKDEYYYSGYISKGDQTLALLNKYIKQLKPEDRPGYYTYCMPVLDAPGYQYFTAFGTPICES